MTAILFLLALLSVDTRNVRVKRAVTPVRMTACDLVTRVDVEQAIGKAVGGGKEQSEGLASTCDYEGSGGLVTVTTQQLPAHPDMAMEIASLQKAIPEGSARRAPGFASAFFFDIPGVGSQLHMLTGERQHLMVSVCGFGEPAQAALAAERIARKAIARL